MAPRWLDIGVALASLAALVGAGIWLLNPLFRVLAAAKAREVMTAAALLVVLGAALLMQVGGLSMAMGAFLAGVLLSESTFRHQLEADVEPFRGILLGLFFLSVGMSLNLSVVAANWPLIVGGVLALMLVKALCIYAVARLLKSCHTEALDRAVLMAQGGEFAFVLFSAAASAQLIDAETNANLTAIVVLSMTLTPLAIIALRKFSPKIALSLEGVDEPNGLSGSVLLIGFGRFGQVVSQSLLARGVAVELTQVGVQPVRTASVARSALARDQGQVGRRGAEPRLGLCRTRRDLHQVADTLAGEHQVVANVLLRKTDVRELVVAHEARAVAVETVVHEQLGAVLQGRRVSADRGLVEMHRGCRGHRHRRREQQHRCRPLDQVD